MKRRPDALALVLVVLMFGAGAVPRSEPRQSAVPAAVIPGGATMGAVLTGTPADVARSGAPGPVQASGGLEPAATTLPSGPRPTVGLQHPSSGPVPHPSPSPTRAAVRQVTRTAAPRHIVGSLTGTVSWFCLAGRSACTRGYGPGCLCAAAGPAVRAALGNWRGRYVTVSTRRASVRVVLSDWCQCPDGRVLDLYASVYGQLDALSSGLTDVRVTW